MMLRRAVFASRSHIYAKGDALQVIDFCGVATVVPVNHRME